MTNVYDILAERGFLKQCSHPEELRELLGKEKVAFYIGYDPTADSLHIGHYVALMTMAHMQRAGHLPIVLLGGGTACIGDPSGKSDMRRMMTTEEIDHNAACFQRQMARLIDFSDGKAIIANNADWLRGLNFLDFMRDIGTQYSVNRMLTFECYKQRMEKGLTFFEMGYMLLQGYDFLELNRKYGCVLQMGDDADVEKCLRLLTFIPMDEIRSLCAEGGAALNNAKKVLAYTLTAQVHGEEEAGKASQAAEALFGGGGDLSNIPTIALTPADIEATGLKVTDLLVMGKLSKSKSDARRLIEAGSVLIGDEKVTDVYATVNEGDLSEGVVIKKGKKGFVRVVKA